MRVRMAWVLLAVVIFIGFTSPIASGHHGMCGETTHLVLDSDGISNEVELCSDQLDATSNDSDSDSFSDSMELKYGLNPVTVTREVADTDGDNLSDSMEVQLGTNIAREDTDSDGISDYEEVFERQVYPDANPTEKDLYVELDVVKSKQEKMVDMALVRIFRDNPTGESIHLHLIVDDTNISSSNVTGFSGLEGFKEANFDRSGEAYYYGAIVTEVDSDKYNFEGSEELVGLAINGGFVIESGDEEWLFLHELGHAIGLYDNVFKGIDSGMYSESEYKSVMNYNFEGAGAGYSSSPPFNDWKFIVDNIEPSDSKPSE